MEGAMNKNVTPPQDQALTLLNIKALFTESAQYVIPIYQRNYAWGVIEIEQLIQDIYDVSTNDTKGKNHYFLGCLIVYERKNQPYDGKKSYEIIDGQQRHTTLCILLAYLKNELAVNDNKLNNLTFNLTFDSRPRSINAFKNLYTNGINCEIEEPNIHSAYNIIDRYFKTHKVNIEQFYRYLFENVKLLRITVPHDTDLNHYFEIINNRGEQLEKHEVLKAKMLSECAEDAKIRYCFSTIWDACSNMDGFVQLNFSADIRSAIFGKDWSDFPNSFADIQANLSESSSIQNGVTIEDIISDKRFHPIDTDNSLEKKERFGSIIDFSNFLLHVLKLTINNQTKTSQNNKMQQGDDVSLDDKKLLKQFYYSNNKLKVEPTEFAFNLLKYRVLFDRYIVKKDIENRWHLLTLKKYTNDFNYINTFDAINEQLVMLLSMFDVSNPSSTYKRWLYRTLEILNKIADKKALIDNPLNYLEKLEKIGQEYLSEICKINGNFSDNKLHQGTKVHNFIFNLLDYLLWKQLSEGKRFNGLGKSELGDSFDNFQFTVRSSVEHYFPQTDPSGAKVMKNVDRFGNLCLISPSTNSRLSNYSPADKKKFYHEKNKIESLKQAIMMSYEDWGPEGQGLENIKKHEEEMINILRSFINNFV